MGHQTQLTKRRKIDLLRCNKKPDFIFFSTQGRLKLEDIISRDNKSNFAWQIFPFGDKKWIEQEIKIDYERCKALALGICLDAPVRSVRYLDRESRYDARKFGKRSLPVSPDISLALKYDWGIHILAKKEIILILIPKGILSKYDLEMCIKLKLPAIWVFNHGGRMFNSGISTSSFLIKNQKNFE